MQSNIHTDYTTTTNRSCSKSTLSWGAIFAGVVIALSIQALFNLLGLALGFSVFTPEAGMITSMGVSSIVWLAVTGIISMFVGGWVAGKAAGVRLHTSGTLHGFVAWSVTTLIVFLFTASAAGAMITAGAATVLNKDISIEANVNSNAQNINANTDNTNIQSTATQKQMKQLSDTATTALSSIAFATFIMFLLSAIAGAIGGSVGYRKHKHICTDTTTHVEHTKI